MFEQFVGYPEAKGEEGKLGVVNPDEWNMNNRIYGMRYPRSVWQFFGVIFSLIPSLIFARSGIEGQVVDYFNHQVLAGVVVQVEGTTFRTVSDSGGNFRLERLPAGKYTLIFWHAGYYRLVLPEIPVMQDSLSRLRVELIPGNDREFLYLSVGGILVTARDSLREGEMGELMEISAGETEHLQATNLGDVLDEIPGVVRVNKPGLWRPMQVGLRDVNRQEVDDRAELFGTRILVDGAPVSNEMNLNTGFGVGLGSKVQSTAGSGVDLRHIPADNLKRIRVISGVPSVEYGDVAGGIIQVETRSGVEPLRLKLKSNPDTRELNLGGGMQLAPGHIFHLNVNYAYSLRDLRIEGDEVSRVHLQAQFSHKPAHRSWRMKEKLTYLQFFENYQVVGDVHAKEAANRDFALQYFHQFGWQFRPGLHLEVNGHLHYRRRLSRVSRYEQMEATYVSDREEDGVQVAVPLVGGYIWEVSTRGREWDAGVRAKLELRHRGLGIRHHWLLGGAFRYLANTGSGKQFNPLYPPYGAVGKRPDRFDRIPPMRHLSYYVQDVLRFHRFTSWQVNLGLRADVYNPDGMGGPALFRGKNGSFLQPRVQLGVEPWPGWRVHVSYGQSSKLPPAAQIFPAPVFVDVMESGTVGNDTVPLIHTHRLSVENPHLKAFSQEKWEVAGEWFGRYLRSRIALFRQYTRDIPVAVQLPYRREVYFWPNWPLSGENQLVESQEVFQRDYHVYRNAAWTDRRGIEFALKTVYLPRLNLMLHVNGAYTYSRYGSEFTGSVSAPVVVSDTVSGNPVQRSIYPVYPALPHWRKRFSYTLRLDYLHRSLGLWFTVTLHHVPYHVDVPVDYPAAVQFARGVVEEGRYREITREEAARWQLQRPLDERLRYPFRYPATVLLNLLVSKRLFPGSEVSFFVNNVLNERGYFQDRYGMTRAANPEIFYGVEFSILVR